MMKKRVFSEKKKKPTFFPSSGLRADYEHIRLELPELKKGAHSERSTAERGDGETRSYVNSKCLSLVFEPLDV